VKQTKERIFATFEVYPVANVKIAGFWGVTAVLRHAAWYKWVLCLYQ